MMLTYEGNKKSTLISTVLTVFVESLSTDHAHIPPQWSIAAEIVPPWRHGVPIFPINSWRNGILSFNFPGFIDITCGFRKFVTNGDPLSVIALQNWIVTLYKIDNIAKRKPLLPTVNRDGWRPPISMLWLENTANVRCIAIVLHKSDTYNTVGNSE